MNSIDQQRNATVQAAFLTKMRETCSALEEIAHPQIAQVDQELSPDQLQQMRGLVRQLRCSAVDGLVWLEGHRTGASSVQVATALSLAFGHIKECADELLAQFAAVQPRAKSAADERLQTARCLCTLLKLYRIALGRFISAYPVQTGREPWLQVLRPRRAEGLDELQELLTACIVRRN